MEEEYPHSDNQIVEESKELNIELICNKSHSSNSLTLSN